MLNKNTLMEYGSVEGKGEASNLSFDSTVTRCTSHVLPSRNCKNNTWLFQLTLMTSRLQILCFGHLRFIITINWSQYLIWGYFAIVFFTRRMAPSPYVTRRVLRWSKKRSFYHMLQRRLSILRAPFFNLNNIEIYGKEQVLRNIVKKRPEEIRKRSDLTKYRKETVRPNIVKKKYSKERWWRNGPTKYGEETVRRNKVKKRFDEI